jgi:hypothetical protein
MGNTTSDETIYNNLGNGFVIAYENPYPEYKLYKTMPCGHQGLLIGNKWVCQTCWGYEVAGGMKVLANEAPVRETQSNE